MTRCARPGEKTLGEKIMLKIFLRKIEGPLSKTPYTFMSKNMAVMTIDDLVKKMTEFNTTLTEADTLAAMNVFKKVVIDYVKQGYAVQTPLGAFFATAGGGAENIDTDFSPSVKDSNHYIKLRFRATPEIANDVLRNTITERSTNALKTQVYIERVCNASGDINMPIKPGDSITISGEYLKFDPGQDV